MTVIRRNRWRNKSVTISAREPLKLSVGFRGGRGGSRGREGGLHIVRFNGKRKIFLADVSFWRRYHRERRADGVLSEPALSSRERTRETAGLRRAVVQFPPLNFLDVTASQKRVNAISGVSRAGGGRETLRSADRYRHGERY